MRTIKPTGNIQGSFVNLILLMLLLCIIIGSAEAQSTVSSLPYSESFESGSGLWYNVTGDDFDWTRRSGGTPSYNTGPTSAYDGSYYYYTESSSPNYPSKSAQFHGPIFDLTNYSSASFSFYYHMYGTAMGTLSLQIRVNGGSWVPAWTKGGNQGNSWLMATVNLDSYVGQSIQLMFRGYTGSSYTSDFSIDKISMTGVEAPSIPSIVFVSSYSEGFESSSGTWINADGDDIDWTRKSGSTSSSNTGPTSAYQGSYYYYTEASSPNYPYKTTYLRGPDFTFDPTVTTATLTFNYHMWGATMGTLALEASTDGGTNWTGIWSLSGDQGNSWKQASMSMNEYLDSGVSLRFLGVIGTSYTGDIAIDNIEINTEVCQAIATPDEDENYVHTINPLTASGACGQTMQAIQYYDGLGRAEQSVMYQASPNLNDIITSLGYDEFGRQHKTYLPYEKANNYGQLDENYTSYIKYTGIYGSLDDSYAFNQTVYEPSPLNRVERQRAPGYSWREGQNREVKLDYGANTGTEVRLLTIANVQSGAIPGFYDDNQLTKNTTWDENQTNITIPVSRVEEFTDKLGRVVCKKVFDGTEEHATHYVYDDFNNLRYVIPPKVVVSNGVSSTELSELCFQYTYDARQRMITKKVPGAETVYMVYDKRDRLVLTQDGVQRAKTPTKQWTYTKYDKLNRPIMTGIYESNSPHSTMQTTVMSYTGANLYETFNTGYTDGYTNNTSFPFSGIVKVLTVTYYDNYSYLGMTVFDSEFDFDITNGINNDTNLTKPKGLATGGKTRMLNDNTWLLSSTYYDNKLRVIQTVSETVKGEYAKTFTEYDFTGNVVETKTVYTIDSDSEEQISERFEYDHANRLTDSWHSVDGQAEVLLASNVYDGIGRLEEKNLHSTDGGASFDQSVDYRYNIRGWLTSINNVGRTNDGILNNDINDLFGMELSYQSSPSGLSFTTQYNGNISGMRWSNEHYDGTQKSYGFVHDGLNRLNSASYKEKTGSTWTVKNGYFDAYNISYDKNGNINALLRKENNTLIDNLDYTYINGGNRLRAVNDITNNVKGFHDQEETATEYTYDENGNMDRDYNKEIQNIRYNMLNLPEEILFEDGNKITYYYDATGVKWRKKVEEGVTIKETDYVGNMILEDDLLKIMHTAEGRIAVDQIGGVNDYKYQYTLKDHLGNNRITFGATEKEYLATMESELAEEEEAQFSKLGEYRERNFVYNHTTGGEYTPDESLMLNSYLSVGGQRRIAGAMKGLKIQANDVVNIEAYAKHASTCNVGETSISTFLFSALTAGFGITSTGETQQAYNALSSLLGTKTLVNQNSCDIPAAYLNYIFFDENYTYKWSGLDQVTSAANGAFEQLSLTFNAGANSGYLYIYVSNESSLNVNVYFDDLKITHSSNLSIVNAEDYYPFGLTFNSYQDTDEQEQDFKYNGIELQDELDLGVYQAKYRTLDPAIGRWWQVDPVAEGFENWTPYNSNLNNPIRYDDPDGDCPTCGTWIPSMITKYTAISSRANGAAQRLITGTSGSTPSNIGMSDMTRTAIKVGGTAADANKVIETSREIANEAQIDVGDVVDKTGEIISDAGLVGAPFTEGASLVLVPVGEKISVAGKLIKIDAHVNNGNIEGAVEELANLAIGAVTNTATGSAIKQSKKVGLITDNAEEIAQTTALGVVGSIANKTAGVATDKIDDDEEE